MLFAYLNMHNTIRALLEMALYANIACELSVLSAVDVQRVCLVPSTRGNNLYGCHRLEQ